SCLAEPLRLRPPERRVPSTYNNNQRYSMPGIEPTYRPRAAWTIAALLAVMMMVNFLDKVVIGLVAVPMMHDLDLTPAQFGLIGGALYWLFSISAVVGGFMANRKPTRTQLLGMGLFWALVQLPMVF